MIRRFSVRDKFSEQEKEGLFKVDSRNGEWCRWKQVERDVVEREEKAFYYAYDRAMQEQSDYRRIGWQKKMYKIHKDWKAEQKEKS